MARMPRIRVIKLGQRDYFKALRHPHPMHRFSPMHRVADVIGRIAARRLNKDVAFKQHLREYRFGDVGKRAHAVLEETANTVVARTKALRRLNIKAENRINYTEARKKTHIQPDLHAQPSAKRHHIIDWKYNGKSALKSIEQMKRYTRVISRRLKTTAGRIRIEARNYADYLRQDHAESGLRGKASATELLPKGKVKSKAGLTTLDAMRARPELDAPLKARRYKRAFSVPKTDPSRAKSKEANKASGKSSSKGSTKGSTKGSRQASNRPNPKPASASRPNIKASTKVMPAAPKLVPPSTTSTTTRVNPFMSPS